VTTLSAKADSFSGDYPEGSVRARNNVSLLGGKSFTWQPVCHNLILLTQRAATDNH